MTIAPPLDLQNRVYTARDDRRLLVDIMAYTRIISDSDLLVTVGGGMNISVAPGRSIISEVASLSAGQFLRAYEFYSDSAVSLALAASNPSNPRVDLIVARVYDSSELGSGPDQGTLEVVTGTPQSGAVLTNTASWPLAVVGAMPCVHVLAAVLVPAASSSVSASNIRDRRLRLGGKSIVNASDTITSTTYALMATPDIVRGVYVPDDGVLKILFYARFTNSVADAGRAAIFIGDQQLSGISSGSGPTVLETAGVSSGSGRPLFSKAETGLYQDNAVGPSFSMSGFLGTPPAGGMAAMEEVSVMIGGGQYDVSIRVKSSSGSVSMAERKLWAYSIDPGGPHGGRF